jgi:type I restriction enzyme, S subunit
MRKFKRYERYKDSGVEWIGEIPEHWGVSKIKFTTYVKGRIGWQGLRADEFIDEGPYLVTGTDFIDGLVNWDSCYHISMERYNEAPPIQLRENDLLITKDGTIGKVAIVKNKPKYAILNSGIFVTRPQNSAYLTEFMYWILNSQVFNRFIEYMSLGSTIVHLYQQTFENFSFPIANLNEQKTIVDFLNKKISEIDDLIADKERLIELLQQKRQAVITEAVTKGLNPNVRMKDSGIEWIGEIPEHWEVKKLKHVSNITMGQSPKSEECSYDEIGVPFLQGNAEFTNVHPIPKMYCNTANKFSKVNDILLSVRAPVGAINISDRVYGIGRGLCAITAKKVIMKYLWYSLNVSLEELFIKSKGSTFEAVTVTDVQNLLIILPPKNEQDDIVNFLDKKTAEIDGLVIEIKKQIEKLKEYRQSLISEAVTGKIDVREFGSISEVI